MHGIWDPHTMVKQCGEGEHLILLIDEVDVFCTFSGATYDPCIYTKDTRINEIIQYIWKSKCDPTRLRGEVA